MVDRPRLMLSKLSSAFGDTRVERVWFAVCSLVALIAVWGHRYPVGIDLPQHANLFRLWTELSNGPWEYRAMYRVELFTPYLLPYLIAYPVTKVVSALAAVKVLYSFTAVGLPLLMRRWLKTIGAEPRLALVGFVGAFGFPYIWGFFSNVVALPMVFGYLNSFERQGERPGLARIAATAAWAVALFLSHGITFGVAMGAAGISYLLRGAWFRRWRALAHFLLPSAVAIAWLSVRSTAVNSHRIEEYLNWDRIVTLFSSAFLPFPDQGYAKIALAGVLLFLLVARPRLRFSAARIAPFALALVAFLALPDWIASTWLVGSRLSVFVHVFAIALLVPREGDVVARQWFHVLGALTLAFLIVLNVRLAGFNREMAGLDVIARAIPRGADLETLVVRTNMDSAVFGAQQLGQTPAWITAERGGMIANDSAVSLYYQIPIKRNDVPFPTRFRYVIGHGDRRADRNVLRSATGSSTPLAVSGEWLLYERPGFETNDFVVIRDAQGYGTLAKDRSIGGGPLRIGNATFEHGLGAHANSFVRIRFKRAGNKLTGLCGLDANAGGPGEVIFQIRDDANHLLFQSAPANGSAPAQAFSIELRGQTELVLVASAPHGIAYAHADWVDLRLE